MVSRSQVSEPVRQPNNDQTALYHEQEMSLIDRVEFLGEKELIANFVC